MKSFFLKTVKRFFLLALLVTVLTGCGKQAENAAGKVYNIYYVDNEETKIFAEIYQTETTDVQMLLEELLERLSTKPDRMQYKAPLAENFELLGYTWDGGQLTINFDEHYKEMDTIKEVLVRAAIVRTLSQIENVNYISFTIQNEPLRDNTGVAIGTMS